MKKMKLAEALLRRKELSQKVAVLSKVDQSFVFKTVFSRKAVNENLDDVVMQVPRISGAQVTAAYDYHARALRKIDAVIQQANWTCEVEVDDNVIADYVEDEKLLMSEIQLHQQNPNLR